MTEVLLSSSEAAKRFKVHRVTIKRWVNAGKLRGFRTVGGHVRVYASDVERLIQANADKRDQ